MKTVFDDETGQLNLELFEPRLLQQTNNLRKVLTAVSRTQSARVESTHFLMALVRVPDGLTQELFRKRGITPRELEEGLAGCIIGDPDVAPPARLSPEILDESARKVVDSLNRYLESGKASLVNEGLLLLATLENLTPAVAGSLSYVQLTSRDLIAEVRAALEHLRTYKPPVLFDDHMLRLEAFSPGGRRVLELMKTEAEALGYPQMDPRHLLLALVEYEGGATHVMLYQQDTSPKRVQEKVIINLRGRSRKTRSQLGLDRESMTASVIRILERAREETGTDQSSQIAEVHLLRSFLQSDTFGLRQLADIGVDLVSARESARQFRPEDEPAPTVSSEAKSLKAIKSALEAALVGQQDVIALCLPFVRRMLFGFRQPGKPAGVLLFCGPSGSGKTEMAKAIARAVFGGEENLIMLEMGQFQAKENMNTFVGAPPGYIGYGEGKLTNGLRDKPRSVVLFDEIEKAHLQVFDALLRFIDEGQIDDPAGPIRDGSECIIVMTSNVRTGGLEELIEGDGYKKNKWKIRQKLREALLNLPVEDRTGPPDREPFRFRPEFLNRIDEIILFRALDEDDLTEIARRHLVECARRLRDEKQVDLAFSPTLEAAARLIGRFCATLDEGARATFRVAQTAILDPVIDFIYEQDCSLPVSLVINIFPPDSDIVEEPHGVVGLREE
jgi:ATP-dependent Clp protease ATP-binding subunit ClpA